MNLQRLGSLREVLAAASARRPLFIVTGRLPGEPWRVTYHAGDGVEGAVVARALLEADGAVVASARRAASEDVSAAFLSWWDDPHFPLLKRDFTTGGPWRAQAALLAAHPLVRALRDGPDVRGALDAFARHDDHEWRFRGVRVLPHERELRAFAPDEAALRALLRPLLLQVPDALPAEPEREGPAAPGDPPTRRRRAPRRP